MISPSRFPILRRLAILFERIPWTRILIVLAVFALVILNSIMQSISGPGMAMLVNMGFIGLVGVFVLQANLSMGPLVILLVAAFVRFALPTGTGSVIVASLLVTALCVALWIVKPLVFEKKLDFHSFPSAGWLWAFIIASCVSMVWGVIFRDTVLRIEDTFGFVQLASLGVMVLLPLSLIFTATVLRSQQVLNLMIISMLLAGAADLAKSLLHIQLPVNGQGLFAMWVLALSISLIIAHKSLPLPIKALLLAIIGLYIFLGFFRNFSWLAGWLPGFIAMGVIALLRSKKTLILFGLGGAILFIEKFDYFLLAMQEESEVSGFTRLAAWMQNWTITREHWLFGTGPAGYTPYYMTYFPTQGMATHSNYLDIISQTGVVGMITYLGFFLALAVYGLKVWWSIRGRGDTLEVVILAALGGLTGSIVIMAFGDWLIPFAYTQTISGFNHSVYTWIWLGTIPVVDVLARRNTAAASV